MIKLTRALRVREDIELPDSSVLHVDFNAETALGAYVREYAGVCKAALALENDASREANDAYRDAYWRLICVCVGAENAARIKAAYDGDIDEVIMMLDPWIADTIQPAVKTASARVRERNKQVMRRGK